MHEYILLSIYAYASEIMNLSIASLLGSDDFRFSFED